MTCSVCQQRPAPVSGQSDKCAECRSIAREVRRASGAGATVHPKFAPMAQRRGGRPLRRLLQSNGTFTGERATQPKRRAA